jgi:hypothetical protein
MYRTNFHDEVDSGRFKDGTGSTTARKMKGTLEIFCTSAFEVDYAGQPNRERSMLVFTFLRACLKDHSINGLLKYSRSEANMISRKEPSKYCTNLDLRHPHKPSYMEYRSIDIILTFGFSMIQSIQANFVGPFYFATPTTPKWRHRPANACKAK